MRNIKSAVIVLSLCCACSLLCSCGEEKVPTVNGFDPLPTETEQVQSPRAIYDQAVYAEQNGEALKAMSLYMQIYDYEDAADRYRALQITPKAEMDPGKISSDCVCFLTQDGKIYGTHELANLKTDPAWTDLVAIAGHGDGLIGLKSDGTCVATLPNLNWEWYSGAEKVTQWTNLKGIAAGSYHCLGLKQDGTVISTEYLGKDVNCKGQDQVSSWENIVQVAAGSAHSLGLRADGTVIACGDNEYGQCDVADWTDIVAIDACTYYSAGLRSDGTVLLAGSSMFGEAVDRQQVGSWKNVVEISVGPFHMAGLTADGSALISGSNNNGECDGTQWKNLRGISCGSSRTLGIADDGSMLFIGNGSELPGAAEINSLNFFTAEAQQQNSLQGGAVLPALFPADIPVYDYRRTALSESKGQEAKFLFETGASYEETFAYYKTWCNQFQPYFITPYDGGLTLLLVPLHDTRQALSILVTRGFQDEQGNTSGNCGVVLLIQGSSVYDEVMAMPH